MPLSEHEQRILAEIERRLLEEDPKFAHQVGSSFRAHLGRRLKLAVAGFVLGLIVVISSTFFENVAIGVAGFVIMLACVFLFVRTMRRRATVERPVGPANASGSAASGPPRRQGGGPKGGIDAWWGKMTDRWRSRWEERGGQGPP
jgi:MFS superfamily sulfate permease-like transporter